MPTTRYRDQATPSQEGEAVTHAITDVETLRDVVGEPRNESVTKGYYFLDVHAKRFLALCPFLCLGTTSRDGKADVSPRGDPPGFVKVLDDRTILIPERPGNRRADSMQNLLENPPVGIVAFLPGVDETLRMNGRGSVTSDPELLAGTEVRGKAAKYGIVVELEEVFFHCGKAIIRSDLWGGTFQIERSEFPRIAEILRDQKWGDDVDQIQSEIDESYRNRLY
jgi:uncharacterized protein